MDDVHAADDQCRSFDQRIVQLEGVVRKADEVVAISSNQSREVRPVQRINHACTDEFIVGSEISRLGKIEPKRYEWFDIGLSGLADFHRSTHAHPLHISPVRVARETSC